MQRGDDEDGDDEDDDGGDDDLSFPWSKTKRKNSKPWSLKHRFTDISAKTNSSKAHKGVSL